MIFGIGVDCTRISRIQKSMQTPGFLQKIYSPQEQQLIDGLQGQKAMQTAAGCFAGKEAFLKACGVGLGGFSLQDIGVLRRESGAPYYALAGKAAEFCKKHNITPRITLTNEEDLAIAFVVLETKNQGDITLF